jgi:hypothetical protein
MMGGEGNGGGGMNKHRIPLILVGLFFVVPKITSKTILI